VRLHICTVKVFTVFYMETPYVYKSASPDCLEIPYIRFKIICWFYGHHGLKLGLRQRIRTFFPSQSWANGLSFDKRSFEKCKSFLDLYHLTILVPVLIFTSSQWTMYSIEWFIHRERGFFAVV